MIGYTTLGTADFERARGFYDSVLAELGASQLFSNEREAYWGHDPTGIKFAVVLPHDGEPPTVGNGSMVALVAKSRDEVDAAHRIALQHGGTDEGQPGTRGDGPFYGAYFRDLDGHKICVFLIVPRV